MIESNSVFILLPFNSPHKNKNRIHFDGYKATGTIQLQLNSACLF
jgi:hypothetical protein